MALIVMCSLVIIMPKSVMAGSITLDKGSVTVPKGETVTLPVKYTLETDEVLKYSYTGAGIDVTDSGGSGSLSGTLSLYVKGVGSSGTSTITVWIEKNNGAQTGIEDTITVTSAPATGYFEVLANIPTTGIIEGDSFTVSAVPKGGHATNDPLTWDITGAGASDLSISGSSASETVTIDQYATFPIVATITVTDADDVSGSCNVNIKGVAAKGITVEDASGQVADSYEIDDSFYLFATTDPDIDGIKVTWTSTNANVAKVVVDPDDSKVAEVTALMGGTCKIRATANGKSAEYEVIVVNAPDTITLTVTPTAAKEAVGKSDIKIVAKATNEYNKKAVYPAIKASDFTWSSDDPSVATIVKTASGDTVNIKGVSVGTATIEAELPGYFLSETVDVEITAGTPVTSFKLPTGRYVTKGKSIKVNATIAPTTATVRNVTWYMDDSTGTGFTNTPSTADPSVFTTVAASSSATGYVSISGVIENGQGSGANVPSENATKVTVVDAPKEIDKYSTSSRTMKVSLPSAVGSGGTQFTVNGYCIEAMDGSTSLASLYVKKDSGLDSLTIDSSYFESVVGKIDSSKLSGSKDTIKFRISPAYCDSSTKASDVYLETDSVTVYKVTTKAGTGVSSTTPSSQWGLEGQTISISASIKSGYSSSDFKWDPSDAVTDKGNTSTTLKVSSDTSKNSVTATASASNSSSSSSSSSNNKSGSGSSSGSSSGNYDKVPKTGEGNGMWAIWVIFFAVIAGAGATLFVMLKKTR